MSDTAETWLEISVEVAGIDAETAADLFRQACSGGAVIEPAHKLDREIDAWVVDGDATSVVRGYMLAGEDTERIRGSLRLALQAAPLVAPARWRRSRRIREDSWRDAWKKHFGIQRIGHGLVIRPSWVEYRLKANETVIHLDPGMAFGTGQHPTTAMCLRALEQRGCPGMSVLDLGCGSGILGIAAAKLGAVRVVALDTDPQAIKATIENAAANEVSAVVTPREGTLDGRADTFDIVAANISGFTLQRLALAISASLNVGGILIASGFLDDAVSNLRTAFADARMRTDEVVEDGVWRAIIASRET